MFGKGFTNEHQLPFMKSDKIVAYSFGASTHEICPAPLIRLNFDPGIRSQVSRTKSGVLKN